MESGTSACIEMQYRYGQSYRLILNERGSKGFPIASVEFTPQALEAPSRERGTGSHARTDATSEAREQHSAGIEVLQATGEVLSEPQRRALEISQRLKNQLAGATIQRGAQVAQLMLGALDKIDELPPKEQWSESDRALVCEMIDKYNRRDAKVMSAVNAALCLNEATPVTAAESPASSNRQSQSGEYSLSELERMTQLPEQRSKLVANLIEQGHLRDTLERAGVEKDHAKRIERNLLSDRAEHRDSARLEIDRHFQTRGGFKGFINEARGRMGAAVILAGVLIPHILTPVLAEPNSAKQATWHGGRN